ncbi:unnamed protein product [Mytilus edulis]|uniref:DDE-1 domain-containing protein n=1 Tax=Mytilus edulis TaxID=6550 RepID=A0A8S3UV01_MYTED|nr:unnamed protein product [Mytilus edulis]
MFTTIESLLDELDEQGQGQHTKNTINLVVNKVGELFKNSAKKVFGSNGRKRKTNTNKKFQIWFDNKCFETRKIFHKAHHFLKYIPGRNNDNVLLLLDGHKSHVAVDIIEWAQEHHIIIHVLPAHTSHILQPLDVGCYGPLQRIYDNECHKTIRKNSSVITKYNICELACKAYQKALCPENLQSAFRKTGIYPLDKTVINQDQLKPSEVFTRNEECKETTETTDEPKTDEIQMQEVELVEVDMNREVTEAVESAVTVTDVVEDMQDHDTDVPHFFAERINKLKK